MSTNLLRYAQGENISDTLSSSIGSSDTSIPVNNISKWSANGGNVIIDRGTSAQEIIVVTGVSGSSLVVASGGRGFDGTTAVGHNSGATIESVPFAKDWNDLITALLNILVLAGTLDTTKVVDLTTSQTLTNKTLTSPTLSSPTITGTTTNPKLQGAASAAQFPQVVGEYDNGNSSTSLAIDWSKGDRQLVTMTGNCTFTYSNATKGQTLTLRIIEDGTGGRTITLPTSKWPGGSAGTFTTTASAINLLVIYYDGTNYLTQLAAGFA